MYEVEVMGEEGKVTLFPSLSGLLSWIEEDNRKRVCVTNYLVKETPNVNVEIHSVASTVVEKSKRSIELDMAVVSPDVRVVGSRMTEDGYELVLEGPKNQVSDILYFWGDYETVSSDL